MTKIRKEAFKFAGGVEGVGARGAEVTDQLGGGHIDSRPVWSAPARAAPPWINRWEQLLWFQLKRNDPVDLQ